MRGRLFLGAACVGLALCACAADSPTTKGRGGGGANGGSGAGSGAGAGGAGVNNPSGPAPMLGDAGPLRDHTQCTADLRRVLDATGVVLKECEPTEGCFDGECIEACQAAAQSKGNLGCEFLAPDPPFAGQAWTTVGMTLAGPCYAVFLANAWDKPVQITVRRNGMAHDVAAFGRIPRGSVPNVTYDPIPATGLPPDEVAILFLSHRPGVANGGSLLECPVPPAVLQDAAVSLSGRGYAFEIATDTPVSAYAILPYGGAPSFLPSATLLLPATSWGTNYFAVGPHDFPDPMQPMQPGKVWGLLVGSNDATTVKVAPAVALPAGTGVDMAPAGVTTTYTLARGEILQWLGADITGTVVEADKPVGLFTGNTYLHIPSATSMGGGHDAAHQQIPHVGALGSEYVAPSATSRLTTMGPESIPYRILGVVDGTTLSYDPAPPAGAPATLTAGQVVQFESMERFTVRSQDDDHPFALTQYMSGTLLTGGVRLDCQDPVYSMPTPMPFPFPIPIMNINGCGDEEWVNVLPPRQFLKRYVFFTDPTYSTTALTVTRVKDDTGLHPVTIGCLGEVQGWQPVGAEGKFEVAYVDLRRAGVAVGTCTESRHVAESDGAFGITVWGLDWFASYAYPAGGNVGTINEVKVPVPL